MKPLIEVTDERISWLAKALLLCVAVPLGWLAFRVGNLWEGC